MAKRTTKKFDETKQYEVKLTRPVIVVGLRFKPLGKQTFSGKILNKLIEREGPDVIDSANPIK